MSAGKPQPRYRLQHISLTTARLELLCRFYCEAFGCRLLEQQSVQGAAFEALMQVRGGAQRMLLALGEQQLELLQFDTPGEPYPQPRHASDLIFQHFAIVVTAIEPAYARLASVPGWSPISTAGPVMLPAASGGVSAFKFRDPEGHPLELLSFPPDALPDAWQDKATADLFLGIDHSAISVAETSRSVAFYQGLGLNLGARTLNHGAEQARLDGLKAPQVEVTALELASPVPHLELLCYRGSQEPGSQGPRNTLQHNDVAATRLVLERVESETARQRNGSAVRSARDPDGHWLLLPCGLRTDSDAAWSGS